MMPQECSFSHNNSKKIVFPTTPFPPPLKEHTDILVDGQYLFIKNIYCWLETIIIPFAHYLYK